METAKDRLPDRVVAFTDNIALADGLARLADGCGIAMAEVLPGGLHAALTGEVPSADVILLDIDDPDEGLEAIAVLAERGHTRLVAVGRQNDVRLYRRMRAAGAAEYLVAPLGDDDLLEALRLPARTVGREGLDTPDTAPRITVAIGCRGGVGATGFAVSTAWWAAEKLDAQTALVDLDLSFGTATLALDLMPGRGLREALEHPERIDPLFIGSAMINATDRLFVLGAEENPGMEIVPAPQGLLQLVEAVAENVSAVVVDLPRTQLPVASDLLRRADGVVLITDLSLGGLRDAIRLRGLIRDTAPEAELTLVAIAAAASCVERREFERAYEGAIDWLVPGDPKAAAEAAAAGKPMVSRLKPKHAYAKAVADIAGRSVPADSAVGSAKKGKRKWLW